MSSPSSDTLILSSVSVPGSTPGTEAHRAAVEYELLQGLDNLPFAIEMGRGLLVLDENYTIEQACAQLQLLDAAHDTIPFAVGDLLDSMEHKTPDVWALASQYTKRNKHTMQNWQSVARAIPYERRNPAVSYTIHRNIAPLPAGLHTALLERAEREQWTVEDALEAIKRIKDEGALPDPPPATATLQPDPEHTASTGSPGSSASAEPATVTPAAPAAHVPDITVPLPYIPLKHRPLFVQGNGGGVFDVYAHGVAYHAEAQIIDMDVRKATITLMVDNPGLIDMLGAMVQVVLLEKDALA